MSSRTGKQKIIRYVMPMLFSAVAVTIIFGFSVTDVLGYEIFSDY